MKKKVVLMALALVVSASFNVAGATQKKKAVKKATVKIEPVSLATPSDSLSYAAGMVRTEGLLPFLKQQYGVDESNLSYVIDGFKATMAQGTDAKAKAYAAGQQIAYMVTERMLPYLKDEFKNTPDSISSAMFTEGFVNSLRKNDSIMADSTARKYFDTAFKAAVNKRNEANRKAGEDFLAANAKKEGVVTLPSGLQYKVITKGTGEVPGTEDEVTVKYEGRLIDGTVFDSSYKRPGETSKFRPDQVIKGWTEALTMMPAGSKWELYIPQNLAYGERNAGQIKPYSALIFTVEMVKVEKKEAKQADAKAAPAAKKTAAKTAAKTTKATKK